MLSDVNGRPRQADVAYSGLREAIVTLQLPPGAALVEDELIHRLQVGRTALREALRRLQTQNLVIVHPRRGTFVSEVQLSDHSLICDVRKQLESHAARRAADRRTPGDLIRLDGLLERVRTRTHTPGRAASMQLDSEIHREIYRCAHNRFLQSDLEHYYDLSLRIWYLFLDRLPEVDHVADHLPLLRAVRAGDGELAARSALRHVTHFEESVNAAL